MTTENPFYKAWTKTQLIRFYMNEIRALRKCSQSFDAISKYIAAKTGVEISPASLKVIFNKEAQEYAFDEARVEAAKKEILAIFSNLKNQFLSADFFFDKPRPEQLFESKNPAPLAHIFGPRVPVKDASKEIFLDDEAKPPLTAPSLPAAAPQKPEKTRYEEQFDLSKYLYQGDDIVGSNRPFSWLKDGVLLKLAAGDDGNVVMFPDGRQNLSPNDSRFLNFRIALAKQKLIQKGVISDWQQLIE